MRLVLHFIEFVEIKNNIAIRIKYKYQWQLEKWESDSSLGLMFHIIKKLALFPIICTMIKEYLNVEIWILQTIIDTIMDKKSFS